jgi:SAM-dependent methyltransferase
MRVFDAGCGGGRNLVYLLRNGYDVAATIRIRRDCASARAGRIVAPDRRTTFVVEPIEATSFPTRRFDVVIASAVLHFARDAAHFESMLRQLWRVLKPGGVFFARLASTIGIDRRASDRQWPLSDSRRFRSLPRRRRDDRIVDAPLGGTLIDPIKTTVVHEQRSMTTWVATPI